LGTGDEIAITDHAYGAIAHTAAFVARERGARVNTIALPPRVEGPGAFAATVVAGVSSATRVLVLDHVSSEEALGMPVSTIVARRAERGVPVLADGAHAPGALALDVPALGADWYTGNLHKWAWSPRSCAILWVSPARQAQLHPTVISWGLDLG